MASERPPFEIPQNYKSKANLSWIQRSVPDYSDGEKRHWPGSNYRTSPEQFYLCFLAEKWAEHDGIPREGVQYYLDKLPEGYAMFEIDQPGGKQVYRRLFGHPSGKYYDSAPRFLVHFLWLMSGMDGDCGCVLCGKKPKAPSTATAYKTTAKPSIPRPRSPRSLTNVTLASENRARRERLDDIGNDSERSGSVERSTMGRAQRRAKQAGVQHAQDEEGTEDIYKDCVKKLEFTKGGKGIEIDLREEDSIDWKAERDPLQKHLTRLEQQHSFIPRVGELVLWCTDLPNDYYLMRDPVTSEYRLYSFKQRCFHGFPNWRGGVVAAAPSVTSRDGLVDFSDILSTPKKGSALNMAGFRVETMPDPNDDVEKSMSKQYRYIPLQNIRPLAQWQSMLKGVPRKKLHPSVTHALTCMTSISLLDKWRFNGDWPVARISCKGIFLGPELIIVGDAVRILAPSQGPTDTALMCTDILVVTSVRYNLRDMKSEHASAKSPYLSGSSSITFVGHAYTTDAQRALGTSFDPDSDNSEIIPLPREAVKGLFRAVGANEYGPWYPLHGPNQKFEVSHEQILGRLYEADAVRLWTGETQQARTKTTPKRASLDFDADSTLAGRRYATATDSRLAEPQSDIEINWFLANTRAEALGIATLNGLDVGRYHEVRDAATLRQWRAQVKIADGREIGPELAREVEMVTYKTSDGARRGRPAGSRVIDGRLVLAGEFPSSDEAELEEPLKKPKSSSQMAGAALASDSEGNTDGFVTEGAEYRDGEHGAQVISSTVALTKQHRPRRVWSKEAIMGSVEAAADAMEFDDDTSDDLEYLYRPLPIRGGTEESEGGDYRD